MALPLLLLLPVVGAFPHFQAQPYQPQYFQPQPPSYGAYQPAGYGGYQPVSTDCEYSEWTPWSPCSAACNQPGFSSRSRVILYEATHYGAACDTSSLEEWRDCFGEECSADCVPGEWGEWSGCSAPCGEGQRRRNRGIFQDALGSGAACDVLEQTQTCSNGPCSQDCVQSGWGQWSACSSHCGTGSRSRNRQTISEAINGGIPCGPCSEVEACDNGPCAQDCAYSNWCSWSQCPSCGGGSRSRSRQILTEGRFGGLQCDFGSLSESEACPFIPCSVDCVMSQWEQWSGCSSDCGDGQRSRFRFIVTQPSNGGRPCENTEEFEGCNNGPCPQDCAYAGWSEWSQCPSCGEAARFRSRSVLVEGRFGGRQCDASSLQESENCPFVPCSVDCVMSSWTAWSGCSAQCGDGERSRTRSILTYPQNGGRQCENTEQYEGCNNGPCPQDCAYGGWSEWSQCPSCGQASRTRARQIVVEGRFGGQQCDFGSLAETESCPFVPCSVDCVLGQWEAWSSCSAQCGEGKRNRYRSILVQPQNGGRQCEAADQCESCNNGPCQQDCVQTNWSEWGACSVTCGDGFRRRTRSTISDSAFGGRPCGPSYETEPCQGGHSYPAPTPFNPHPAPAFNPSRPVPAPFNPHSSPIPAPRPFANPSPVSYQSGPRSIAFNPSPFQNINHPSNLPQHIIFG